MLPELNTEEDIRALSDAVQRVFKPVVDEMLEKLDTVKKATPEKNDIAFYVHTMQYAIDSVKESIKSMTAQQEKPLSSAEVVNLISTLSDKNAQEQEAVLSQLLSNKVFQGEILSKVDKELFAVMNEHLEELVKASEVEKKDRDDVKSRDAAKDRMVTRKESEVRAKRQTNTDIVTDLTKGMRALPNMLDDIVMGLRNVGVLFGAAGLFSMLPKQVQEFIGTFTQTFTYIRGLLNNSFLAPMMRLVEGLPLLGPLVKKLPYISAFVAAFEIIPDTLEAYTRDGIWKAMEVGLRKTYDFFVGDVADLVAQFGEWVQEKLFGSVIVDLRGAVSAFSERAHEFALDMVKTVKSYLTGDWKGMLSGLSGLAEDTINAFVNAGLAAFRLPANWDASEKATQLWGAVTESISSLKSSIISGIVGAGSDVVNYGSGLWSSLTESVSNKWTRVVGSIEEMMFDATVFVNSIRDAVTQKWNSGIEAIGDIKESVADTFTGLWTTIKNKITSAFDEAVASLSSLKDMMATWFETMVKKTANYIVDFLPMGLGDSLKFEIPTDEKTTVKSEITPKVEPVEKERRLMTSTQRLEKAQRDEGRRGPVRQQNVKVDNRRTSSEHNINVGGAVRATSRGGPLETSNGGGAW